MLAWCLGGDFNMVKSVEDKWNCSRKSNQMQLFSDFIDDLEGIDLPLNGSKYTWSNSRSKSRIDRFLVSNDWEDLFPEVLQKSLPRLISDHYPLLLDGGGLKSGPKPFRFENMWLHVEGFTEMVDKWWQSYEFFGSASFILSQKLKCLKQDLRRWNLEVFGNVKTQKQNLEKEIQQFDQVDNFRMLTDQEHYSREAKIKELNKLIQMEETSWRQKSRIKWLKEGDRNTKYFHKIASANKRKNWIDKLKVNGSLTEDQNLIKQGILGYYKQLFREQADWRPKVNGLNFSQISMLDAESLEQPFAESEIVLALNELSGDKAPGPDGWTIAFFQKCWSILRQDVLQVFTDFHSSGRFVRCLNSTFIALIPKKKGAVDVKDFRPISLVGAIYKLLAKVLAARMKKTLDSIISNSQNAFVGGRQILDAALVANEVIDSKVKRKEIGMVCKLDIEKAFDHVNWNCLIYLMKRMGFGDKWCSWIHWCISTVQFSVLINGTPEGFFASSRGLRQGDPLSPFLFIIVMEVLSKMLQEVEAAGLIEGFLIKNRFGNSITVSHLLFADDTIVFCGADIMQMGHLRCTLLGFEAVTGLRINLNKSELLPVGDASSLTALTDILGCKTGSLPTTYLGLPLGAKFNSRKVWEPVLERCRSRLAVWKLRYLSTGARITLIKSVLSSLPTYFLSLFKAPISVINELEKMQRNFLWGRVDGVFKHSLVNWNSVCSSIVSGGLGIRKLKLHNEALLGKWLWKFPLDNNRLWKSVIVTKYGEDLGGWCSMDSSRMFGSSLWSGIRKIWGQFSSCISWKVGRGDRVLFWKQNWMAVGWLAERFPRIFALALNKDAVVSDYCSGVGRYSTWNILLRRNINDWELEEYLSLLELLENVHLDESDDSIVWQNSRDHSFTVKSFYLLLRGEDKDLFPWQKFWKFAAPTRVSFFTWCATKGKILTMDNLKHRGYYIVNRCILCCNQEESIDHLLLHCQWAVDLWGLILSCFGIHLCFPKDINDFLLAWWGQPLRKNKKKIWNLVPFCMFWLIWKERNRRIFEDECRSISRIKSLLLTCLFNWAKEGKEIDIQAFLSFIDHLY